MDCFIFFQTIIALSITSDNVVFFYVNMTSAYLTYDLKSTEFESDIRICIR